jgi:membrane peptidoglycan carboxypeptidase
MGITDRLGRNLSLSLGTSEVSLFQLTSAYTVFPNSGVHVEPVMVKRIEDRYGNVLEDNTQIPLLDDSEIPHPVPREEFRTVSIAHTGPQDYQTAEDDPVANEESASPQAAQNNDGVKEKDAQTLAPVKEGSNASRATRRVRAAMSPQTAYIMTSLLQGGVRQGTGARMVKYVKRKDLAGKTGTTNNAEDTWFIGFNPEFTAGVWVGFDEKRPLGSREEGARAALPVWGYFMREVLQNRPEKEFPVPPGITFQDMLTFTGSPSQGFSPKLVREPIYTPFVGKTLVLCPLDTPETLAAYRIPLPGLPAEQSLYGYQQTGQPQPSPYPMQPGSTPPVNPMDGRNLFPDQVPHQGEASPRQNTAPPQPAGVSNFGPGVQRGYVSEAEAPIRPSMGNPQPPGPDSDQPQQQNLSPREDPRSYQQPNPNSYFYHAPATRGPQ